jgi:hypothetical protein
MAILTYLKIGGAVMLLAVAGFFYWNYHHLQNKVVTLQTEIDGLKLRAEVIEKAQRATDEYVKQRGAIQRKVTSVKAKVDQVVEAGDDIAMRDLFILNGLLQSPKAGATTGRPKGNP